MATEPRPLINDDLLNQLEETARRIASLKKLSARHSVGISTTRDGRGWQRRASAGQSKMVLRKKMFRGSLKKCAVKIERAIAECSAQLPIPT
jgi:hypothetical protein